jgi:hypothetical protein
MFGITFEPNVQYNSSQDIGTSLNTLPTLVDLQLHFDKYTHHGALDDYRKPYSICQRTYVDWVMAFAYPYIHDSESLNCG